MFEKIKNWFNPESKPPLWAMSVHSTLDILDAQNKILRDRLFNLENQQSLILKQIDNDALVVANLTTRILELEANEVEEDKTQLPIAIELRVPFKVGDKVRIHNCALGEDFDGKTGRIVSTKLSDTGSGHVLYSVRFPRKIQDSAIHEFYDDEIELVEE